MKPRHAYRLNERIQRAAALCQVSPSEWVSLTRSERRRRLWAVRRG
ncbi:hypothetical protein GCM10010168_86130 [Actinoplanes ianthinogenes]|uniref:Uncharacterized protein n=1 Tax=Actinoplanes ianthinogenes TaxID=122358 RepID=A0ABN6CK25_9ACTN|nr:hypothetical protein Aiant_60010 [Actinoplanes ianthinogenes]GGR53913.1 hypothetical protein GCM10010168_86130 [Actinoplanes ianthinogenes]